MAVRVGTIFERYSRHDRETIKIMGSILVMDVAIGHSSSIICKCNEFLFLVCTISEFTFSLSCYSIGSNINQPHMATTSTRYGPMRLVGLLVCYPYR